MKQAEQISFKRKKRSLLLNVYFGGSGKWTKKYYYFKSKEDLVRQFKAEIYYANKFLSEGNMYLGEAVPNRIFNADNLLKKIERIEPNQKTRNKNFLGQLVQVLEKYRWQLKCHCC